MKAAVLAMLLSPGWVGLCAATTIPAGTELNIRLTDKSRQRSHSGKNSG